MSTQLGNGTITFGDSTTQANAAYLMAQGVIYENNKTLSQNYTITSNRGAMSVGPITLAGGVSVTIPGNSKWVIL